MSVFNAEPTDQKKADYAITQLGLKLKGFINDQIYEDDIKYFLKIEATTPLTITATNSYYFRDNGEKVTDTTWHSLVFYGKRVDIVEKYVQSGTPVFIQGALRNQSWQDKEGNQRTSTQIVVQDLRCLNRKTADVAQPESVQPEQNHQQSGMDAGMSSFAGDRQLC